MENIKRLRAEMCNMLCSMGHNMEELEVCSNSDLMQMCQDKMNMENQMMENHDMSRTEMCMMLCNMGHKIEELEVCSNDELMHICKSKMNMNMDNMNMDKEMMESTRIIKSWKQYESLHESSDKELKSFQKELKEMERKRESLIKHGKGLPSPSAYASKNKVNLKTVEKEIKDIESKIAALKK